MKILTFVSFFLLLLPFARAQDQEFRLSGTYLIDGSVRAPVSFSLRWSENGERLEGEYRDDRFTSAAHVTGTKGTGNNFAVTLPAVSKGIKTITILGPRLKKADTGRTVPLTVVTRDMKGNPVTTAEVSATFIAEAPAAVAQRQEEAGPDCVTNFGELPNVCGIYGGVITEEADASRSCGLTNASAFRMEIDPLGEVRIHLEEVNELVVNPAHNVGRISANPASTSIDVMNRECRALPHAAFAPDNCKRLNLTGTFSRDGNAWHFTGSYLITDEKNGRSCRYRLSLDQGQD